MPNTRTHSQNTNYPSGIIQGLFKHNDAIIRHLNAPMLEQRQFYLGQLSALGRSRQSLAVCASTLRRIVESPVLKNPKGVTEEDISRAVNEGRLTARLDSKDLDRNYKTVARGWYKFLGFYVPRERDHHQYKSQLIEFKNALQHELGYLPATVRAWVSPIRSFLDWLSNRQRDLAAVSLLDIDSFIAERRSDGAKNRTIACHCQALRAFFRYAQQRGWNHHNLGKTIRTPVFRKQANPINCPSWSDVRRMIDSLDDSRPTDCRAKVIMLLASIYGLRCTEISQLTLDDIDWYNEVLTVRRVKRGKVQQFPLQYEVGQAIIHYLKTVRPAARVRNLIITLKTPYGPVMSIPSSMAYILSSARMMGRPCGLHSLRHACATELLRKGTSLQGIADLLGHNSLRSVSIYAHCNILALQKVAEFSLGGIL